VDGFIVEAPRARHHLSRWLRPDGGSALNGGRDAISSEIEQGRAEFPRRAEWFPSCGVDLSACLPSARLPLAQPSRLAVRLVLAMYLIGVVGTLLGLCFIT
jgi:hypothetical protein